FVFTSIYEGSIDTLHLHSFPTRRSSDLIEFHPRQEQIGFFIGMLVRMQNVAIVLKNKVRNASNNSLAIRTADQENGGILHQALRSEEHTSELQSRGHLVCRLLLEKKKNN